MLGKRAASWACSRYLATKTFKHQRRSFLGGHSDSEDEASASERIVPLDQAGVYGWGHSDRGQLGQGSQTAVLERIQHLDFPSITQPISQYQHIRAQEDGSIFITRADSRNYFYGTGDGTSGISGFQTDDPVFEPRSFENPQQVHEPEIITTPIADVSCGRFHVNYLTEDGQLWVSGSSRQGQLGFGTQEDTPRLFPVQLDCFPAKLKQVASGCFHSLAVTEEGELFSWGANLCFQLGHGDWNPRHQPEKVVLPEKVRVASTSVFHSLVVTEDNRIFGWGQNKENQLGRSETAQDRTIPLPTEIQHTIPEQITQVYCGLRHNLFLTESGELFVSGNNAQSQLGQGKSLFFRNSSPGKPMRIPTFEGVRMKLAHAGSSFSYAVSEETGELWGWGYAPDFQFGVVNEGRWERPQVIARASSDLQIKSISSGGFHAFIHVTE